MGFILVRCDPRSRCLARLRGAVGVRPRAAAARRPPLGRGTASSAAGDAPRRPYTRRSRRGTTAPSTGDARQAGSRGRRRSRWTSPWVSAGPRLHPADPVVEGDHARRLLDPVERARPTTAPAARRRWDAIGTLGRPRRHVAPHVGRRARTTTCARRRDRHLVADAAASASSPGRCASRCTAPRARRARRSTKVGAVASRLPADAPATPPPTPHCTARSTLNVPAYSQMTHQGEYPQYGGGGEAWCSPTSTAMVLGYYDALPAAGQYALGDSRIPRPLGRPRRPRDLRLRLRRHRQLAVQHRLRRRRYADDAFVTRLRQPARGRAVHPRRHPARRLDRLRPRRARRRPDLVHQRPPGRDRRASPPPATWWSTTPRPPPTAGAPRPTTAPSSSAPGCASRAAPST